MAITILGTHPMRIAGCDWLGLDGLTCLGYICLASLASAHPPIFFIFGIFQFLRGFWSPGGIPLDSERNFDPF